MQKLNSLVKNSLLVMAVLLFTVPTFFRMLKPGMYSTQDFHFFRLVEFDKCFKDTQLPCRWAPDAGFGYGEPIFNFYGQATYLLGEVFHVLGLSLVESLKLLFILSLVGSGITMFFLSRYLWKSNLAALASAVMYIYAPYRAVDVWVRGALPEACAFVLYPLIILFLGLYFRTLKLKYLVTLSVLFTLLISIHNLSFVLFLPIVLIWVVMHQILKVNLHALLGFLLSIFIAFVLSAFYILPLLFESKFVNLESTIRGYFNFEGHYVTLYQLLVSRFWGYGASVFGNEDGMSLSIGHLQWLSSVLLIVVFVGILYKQKVNNFKAFRKYLKANYKVYVALTLIFGGWFCLFLTHNQSIFIWKILPQIAYLQFPWRFFGPALFCFALAPGILFTLIPRLKYFIVITLVAASIGLNYSYFREDIWSNITDNDLTNGPLWELQEMASARDYWPRFGPVPQIIAKGDPIGGKLLNKKSNKATYKISLKTYKEIELPVAYFPGWEVTVDDLRVSTVPSQKGLIEIKLPAGEHDVTLNFQNTLVRSLGEEISLIGLFFIIVFSTIFWRLNKLKA